MKRLAAMLCNLLLVWIAAGCLRTATTPVAPTATPVPRSTPVATATAQPAAAESVETFTYRIVESLPHDIGAFTQGLVYHDGFFYEGTGLGGQSTLRKVNPETGQVVQRVRLPDEMFGEGVTLVGDKLFQLTWQSHKGFIYSLASMELLDTFVYPTEGWGLTDDESELMLSDGSATIYVYDPSSLTEVRRIAVHDGSQPIDRINELEYIDGRIYANIWMTDRIAVIDPSDGRVTGWIDLTGLLTENARAEMLTALSRTGIDAAWVNTNAVLNGIAYDAEEKRLFVTGKLWPAVYVIELAPTSD